MRFQVPQNLDISDTIFLGLDFKQLLYIGGAVGFVIFLFIILSDFLISVLLGAPVIGFALLLSFFNLNNQPFITVLQSVMLFLMNKKIYIWKQEGSEEYAERKMRRDDVAVSNGGSDAKKVRALNADLIFDDSEQEDELRVYL